MNRDEFFRIYNTEWGTTLSSDFEESFDWILDQNRNEIFDPEKEELSEEGFADLLAMYMRISV